MKPKVQIIVVAIAIVAVLVLLFRNHSIPLKVFRTDHFSFQYPTDLNQQSKPATKQNQSETILKLSATDPLRVIELAKETAAIKGAAITRTNFLDYLENNALRRLARVYTNYQNTGNERIKISGHDAAEISFSYIGQDNITTIYLKYLIMPLGNNAYYMTIQSTDQQRLEDISMQIINSIELRI